MKKIKVVLIGAGNRGSRYTDVMHMMPEKFQVVAVVDPAESRRKHVQQLHNIPDEMCFDDYADLFRLGKIADLAIVATQDRLHYAPAMQAISLKYDVLLEKPISPSAEECLDIEAAARRNGVKVIVCTVLRYASLFSKTKEIIVSGKIGEVVSVDHEECVGNVHQSHSYVRGNWGNSERSSGMLLAKSCHDLDLIAWMLDRKCTQIQSFGSLRYFKRENAPADSPERCIDGCPHGDTCPYNAVKLYLDDKKNHWFRSTSTNCSEPTDADVEKTLRNTQYGKCVYKCDNDVVDHQTVNMLFEDGITATFTMCAFNRGGRFLHVMGTKGELRASLKENDGIRIYDFETREETVIPVAGKDGIEGKHGGGDVGIVECLYRYLTGEGKSDAIPSIDESCHNHMLVFAAERSRELNQVVDVAKFIDETRRSSTNHQQIIEKGRNENAVHDR